MLKELHSKMLTNAAGSCSSFTKADKELYVQVYNYLATASYSQGEEATCGIGLSVS